MSKDSWRIELDDLLEFFRKHSRLNDIDNSIRAIIYGLEEYIEEFKKLKTTQGD